MSQWQQILMLDTVYRDQVLDLYSDERLPMEVREYIAYWIEEQDWNQAAQFESSLACCLFHTMQSLLDDQLGRLVLSEENNSNILLKHNLHRSKIHLQALYQDQPEQLARVIDDLLRQERHILAASLAASQPVVEAPAAASMTSNQQEKIEARLAEMRRAIQALKTSIDQLELLQDTFDFRYKTQKLLESTVPNTDPGLIRRMQELQTMVNNVDRSRKDVLAQIQGLLGLFETLRDLLLEELEAWEDRQRQACIGNNCDTSLGELERWFTANAEDLFHLLQLLQTLKDLQEKLTYDQDQLKSCLPQLKNRLEEQISFLLKRAFVVEIQPTMPYPSRRPLVLRTNQKFSVRARLLVKLMDRNNPMEANIEIDRDSTHLAGFRKFNILTSSTTKTLMMDKPQMDGLICDFKHISLKEQKICGSGKGKGGKGINEGGLSVLEELHVITFTLNYCYQGLKFQLQTSTLPMVIVSNVNQMSSAWASILWFIMLSRGPLNQQFFINPPAATWPQLSTVLSWQFSTATEKGLNVDQLKMLGEKLCGSPVTAQSIITWTQFSKDSPNSFSFWTWIDGILLLIQENLLHLWRKDLIMGFVSHKRERHLLKKKRGGTFLLRFSESTRNGGITCTWVEYDDKGSPEFSAVEPYTREQLKILPLPDIIRDYHILADEVIPENPLQYLYPDTPRDEAFGPYYSECRKDLSEKYLKRRLISVSSRPPEEALDIQVADANAPEVNGEIGIALPNGLEELEQEGLLYHRQDPYLPQLEEEQYLAQMAPELFLPSEELQELKLYEGDFNL